MLKRDITFENFNGEQVTETHYFNLTKAELIDMEVSTEGGFGESLKRIVAAKNFPALVAEMKKLVLASYGEKSADGMRFVKSDDIRTQFAQTAAFDALYTELATNEEAAANFVIGIFPKDMTESLAKEIEQARTGVKTQFSPLPPPPPLVSTTDL